MRRKPAILDEEALYDTAVRLLGQQMRTVAELKRVLRRRVEPGPQADAKLDAVIARLQERNYLSDTAYATDYARLRQENAGFGKRRVQQDLLRKGVQADVISRTLDSAYEGVSEEALARRHLERKRIKKPSSQKESARVARMLLRAGFGSATIFRILQRWDVDDEILSALDSLDAGDDASETDPH